MSEYDYKKVVIYFNLDNPNEKILYEYLKSESEGTTIAKYVKSAIRLRMMIEQKVLDYGKK